MAAASLGSSGSVSYKTVDEWESPIPELWTYWSLENLFNLKISFRGFGLFKSEFWAVQAMAMYEYFIYRSDWKSQWSGEGRQCIYICILLARYMVDVESSKLLNHVDGYVVIGYQVFMSDCVLSAKLVDDEFWITICFEMLDTNLFCKLRSDQQSIVFHHIIGARLSWWKCMRNYVVT